MEIHDNPKITIGKVAIHGVDQGFVLAFPYHQEISFHQIFLWLLLQAEVTVTDRVFLCADKLHQLCNFDAKFSTCDL